MTPTPKIGITERGDAGIDLSWADKLDTVDGAIVITKRITDANFQQKLLENQDKLILHADITGNGNTVFEPNVPDYKVSFAALHDIIAQGFPKERIVLRCDPIIPNTIGLYNVKNMFTDFLKENFGITRVRISVLDNYRHTKKRFYEHGIPVLYDGDFQAPTVIFEYIATMLDSLFKDHPEIHIECCAEPQLQLASTKLKTKPIEWTGCCGFTDATLLGITLPNNIGVNPQNRKGCLCLSVKKELLTNPKPCPHKCLYCYWKD